MASSELSVLRASVRGPRLCRKHIRRVAPVKKHFEGREALRVAALLLLTPKHACVTMSIQCLQLLCSFILFVSLIPR